MRRPPPSPPLFPSTTLFRSWEIPDRPRNKALFENGREILLFSKDKRSEEHTSELQSQFHLLFPFFFFKCAAPPQVPPSSPPRRSSDLGRSLTGREIKRCLRMAAKFCYFQKIRDRKSTRLNSSHSSISYSLFFFLNAPPPPKSPPLPLHDALPILGDP